MDAKIQEFKSIKTMPSPISLNAVADTRKIQSLHEFYCDTDSSSELADDVSEFILYYMMGATFVRPMGIFSGKFS